jgi:hypothetical protein
MQVPKLVGDEVEAAEGDLLTWQHSSRVIINADNDSHLKHDINLNAKGPYLARQLSDCLALAIPSNAIT